MGLTLHTWAMAEGVFARGMSHPVPSVEVAAALAGVALGRQTLLEVPAPPRGEASLSSPHPGGQSALASGHAVFKPS